MTLFGATSAASRNNLGEISYQSFDNGGGQMYGLEGRIWFEQVTDWQGHIGRRL